MNISAIIRCPSCQSKSFSKNDESGKYLCNDCYCIFSFYKAFLKSSCKLITSYISKVFGITRSSPSEINSGKFNRSANHDDIVHCYRLLLERYPDEQGWRTSKRLVDNGCSLKRLVSIVLSSPEFKNRKLLEASLDAKLVLVSTNENFFIYASRDDNSVGLKLINGGEYEPHVTRIIKKVLKPDMTFVDIGANIGYYSLLAGSIVGNNGKVFSFEPSSKNCQFLFYSARKNAYNNIRIICAALADKYAAFFYDNLDGSNGIVSDYEGDGEDFISRSLVYSLPMDDLFLNSDRLDIIKIDVEGAEYRVLKGGGERTIKKFHPIIFSEYGIGGFSADYLGFFVQNGYYIHIISEHGKVIDCADDVNDVIERANKASHLDLVMTLPDQRSLVI